MCECVCVHKSVFVRGREVDFCTNACLCTYMHVCVSECLCFFPYVCAGVATVFSVMCVSVHAWLGHTHACVCACVCYRGSGPMPGSMPDQCSSVQAQTRPTLASLG